MHAQARPPPHEPHSVPLPTGGNVRWLLRLCEGVPIFYSSPVREIRYCASGVAVHTQVRGGVQEHSLRAPWSARVVLSRGVRTWSLGFWQ